MHCCGNVNGVTSVEMLRQFLKHLNTELLHDWHFHVWVYKQHKWKQGLEQTLCTQFTAAYSQQPKMKEAKSPSLDEWINEVCSIHTMKYYSALERQKANTATTRMNLKDVMLMK